MTLTERISALATRLGQAVRECVKSDHPGLARAWACFGWDKGSLTLHAGHNVAQVERLATGKYRVTFASPMPDANYAWLAFARNAGAQNSMKFAAARATAEKKSPLYLDVICTTASGSLTDTAEFNVVVYR